MNASVESSVAVPNLDPDAELRRLLFPDQCESEEEWSALRDRERQRMREAVWNGQYQYISAAPQAKPDSELSIGKSRLRASEE